MLPLMADPVADRMLLQRAVRLESLAPDVAITNLVSLTSSMLAAPQLLLLLDLKGRPQGGTGRPHGIRQCNPKPVCIYIF